MRINNNNMANNLIGMKDNVDALMDHRKRIFWTTFLYLKDNNLDWWAGNIFYEAGCGPDLRDRDSWTITNGNWILMGKELRDELLKKK